ncbi:MAG: DUF1571 domain-containing protein [Planctomycetaceae bacterium]
MRKFVAGGITLASLLVLSTAAPVRGEDSAAPASALQPAAAGEHPLAPAIAMAKAGLDGIRANIKDYSCTMVKREMVDGKLGERQFIFVKVRHEPLSVYLNFLAPEEVKGQEVVWVKGRNNDNMLAHAGSGVRAMAGTLELPPDGPVAMSGQRYPITEIGVENLTKKLIEVAEHDSQFAECTVNFFPGAKVNGRVCTCIQVQHPDPRPVFRYHLARVFIDDEMKIPTRFEAYDWPTAPGEPPVLLEEYTYMNVKLNNGFGDEDFDATNKQYKFGVVKPAK